MKLLDLFCGRGGWTNAFLERGWACTGVDIVRHDDYRGEFIEADVLSLTSDFVKGFDFVCASSPCEEFSIHGMPHFWPNPKFPDMGLVLFCWTRRLLDRAGVPYVMENVRAAQRFVGDATQACGPFMLWGDGVPPLMPQGINKGMSQQRGKDGRRNGPLEHVSKAKRKSAEIARSDNSARTIKLCCNLRRTNHRSQSGMTPTSLLSEDRRRRIAAFVVWGRPGQFLTRRQIERRVEKILEQIAKKLQDGERHSEGSELDHSSQDQIPLRLACKESVRLVHPEGPSRRDEASPTISN